MRNLTVKREKSFVACLITMKVFAEDKEHGETVIDGTPCRRRSAGDERTTTKRGAEQHKNGRVHDG